MEEIKIISGNSRVFQARIIKYLKNNFDDVLIRSDKFLFDKIFYEKFIQEVLRGEINAKINSFYYKNFQHLVYHDVIHTSSSKFPKGLTKKSVNPVPKYLYCDTKSIDLWVQKRQEVLRELEKNNIDFLYIYLRYFHLKHVSEDNLSKIRHKDIIILPDREEIVLYTECASFISTSSVYRLIRLDKYASKVIKSIDISNKNTLLFKDFKRYEDCAKSFRKSSLNTMKISTIKNSKYNFYARYSSHLEVTMERNYIPTVELTISELIALFPDCDISTDILLREKQRIEDTFINRSKQNRSEAVSKSESYTDFMDFEYLAILLRSVKSYIPEEINQVIDEIKRYIVIHNNVHSDMIYSYILHLLYSLKAKKIKLSTFKNYFYTLNKYIFRTIENLDDIQEDEISSILNKIHELKLESQKTVVSIIRTFFSYHVMKNDFKVDFNRVHYPKSMVFDYEIDIILDEIENRGKKENWKKFYILQMQMTILFGYYGGLRRNEIRSRRIKDFIIINANNLYTSADPIKSCCDLNFYIDVNKLGYKKLEGKSLKNSNAERRVSFTVKSDRHFNIIRKYLVARKCEKINRNELLFVSLRKNGQQSKQPQNENIFDSLNEIIKDVTKRYCTFHSLRHSFATYFMKRITDNKTKYDDCFELNVQCGHSLLSLTLNKYTHWNLLKLMN